MQAQTTIPTAAPAALPTTLMQEIASMEGEQRGRLFHQLALALFQEGKLDEAMTAIGDAMSEGQTSMRWNDFATIALARNESEAAVLGYRRAVELDANNQRARVNLVLLLRTLDCAEEAESFMPGTDTALMAAEQARIISIAQQR